jgi:hypothetical protein
LARRRRCVNAGIGRLLCGNRKCGLRPQATPSAFSGDCFQGQIDVVFRRIADIHTAQAQCG